MLKWIQGGISSVTGIAEPEYGPECIHSCTTRVSNKQSFNEAVADDFKWQSPENTHVETSTFYFTDLKKGYNGFAQIIHSNIGGIHTTAQFTFKLYKYKNYDASKAGDFTLSEDELAEASKDFETIWTSTKLSNFRIEGKNFFADNLSIEWISDTEVHFKSAVNPASVIDLVFVQEAPSVKVGVDPHTYYGDNLEAPWGSMSHVFRPRNKVTGSIKTTTNSGAEIVLDKEYTKGMFVMALQGMKPHHAAKAWKFINFQNQHYSVVLMEFTTPKSYANTVVSIAIVAKDDKIVSVPVMNDCRMLELTTDDAGWGVPKSINFQLNGFDASLNDSEVETKGIAGLETFEISGTLTELTERVDVMNEMPQFVKNIVSGVAGTKPYIYQFYSQDLLLKLPNEEKPQTGPCWFETTYIVDEEVPQQ
ncbi:hypothetical protein ACO0RG_000639 [Hanseniaspora osmophila]|uniref:Survival factor 1 n=1 Tax=Hanseniaspora osmophila TaxID=56408 RepID=A0A1E5R2G0_9ASCO|nr:Survival factor 1 [Hanseniaspora osmophila]